MEEKMEKIDSIETTDPQARPTSRAGGEHAETAEWARRGGLVLALLVLAISLLVAFQAVTQAIETWFEPRWVPIWRAGFALLVAGLALWVVQRLTR